VDQGPIRRKDRQPGDLAIYALYSPARRMPRYKLKWDKWLCHGSGFVAAQNRRFEETKIAKPIGGRSWQSVSHFLVFKNVPSFGAIQ
jgi:hypothetical protein